MNKVSHQDIKLLPREAEMTHTPGPVIVKSFALLPLSFWNWYKPASLQGGKLLNMLIIPPDTRDPVLPAFPNSKVVYDSYSIRSLPREQQLENLSPEEFRKASDQRRQEKRPENSWGWSERMAGWQTWAWSDHAALPPRDPPLHPTPWYLFLCHLRTIVALYLPQPTTILPNCFASSLPCLWPSSWILIA